MRSVTAALVLIGMIAVPLGAKGHGKHGDRKQGIPPGHLPPPGACRVWYDGVPPGHQPPPTSCRDAERVAARDRNARVIYGGDEWRNGGWRDQDDERDRRDRDDRRDRGRPRANPRRDPYPYPGGSSYPESRYPSRDGNPNARGGDGYESVPFDNGYKDGYDQGRKDGRDNSDPDPVRQGRYRSGDRGYDRRYGSKEDYKNVYREGFRAGYDDGYRETNANGRDGRRSGMRLPWPF